ncbi:MAG: hypothetical protein WD034_04765 [Parvibaculum sp.]|uniref:hypothetical protein n=1 Tax=Parvibaculum sp. TaxID=2024848 RepID=UPI0034A09DD1
MSGRFFVHPDDEPVLGRGGDKHIHKEAVDFESYIRSEHFGKRDSRFHTSLLPIPYGGDLSRADIFVLLLNPGFSHADYFGEFQMPEFRKRLEKNLAQNFEDEEFPFLWLDPKFSWHSGFVWWEKKLRDVVMMIAEAKYDGSYLDALRDLSRRLALVELVPYHSSHFNGHTLIKSLPSSRAAKRYVADVLMRGVRTGEKTIIVTRQEAAWDLGEPTENCVIYKGGLTRGASLGPTTPGGAAILRKFNIPPSSA